MIKKEIEQGTKPQNPPPKLKALTHKQLAEMWECKYWDLVEKISKYNYFNKMLS